ncbi:MAG TPA: L-threonylcarbamoyladenylate synthase [Patescibacteria group bacterium]
MKVVKSNHTRSEEVIKQAIEVLNAGGLVIFPTETTYGAGVDATNQAAVDKLLAYKSRREGKPLSIAVPDQTSAEEYVELNDSARNLYARFLPGPVTVVSKSKGQVAQGVASEFGTVGVRIPDYPLMLELLRAFGKPITATSANASNAKRPYSIEDIFDGLSGKQKNLIDFIIDAGELPHNEPSTVIDTTLSTPITLRERNAGQTLEKDGNSEQTVLHSFNPDETQELAGRLMLKHWNDIRDRGLVVGLDGALGTGKTIFTKGVAEFLGIKETIVSPTYSYCEEYAFERHGVSGKLLHCDAWKVDEQEVFEKLALDEYMKPKNVVVIEWWSQVATWIKPELPVVHITFNEVGEGERTISIEERWSK